VSEVKHLRLLVAQNPGWLAGLPVVGCLAFPFGSPPHSPLDTTVAPATVSSHSAVSHLDKWFGAALTP